MSTYHYRDYTINLSDKSVHYNQSLKYTSIYQVPKYYVVTRDFDEKIVATGEYKDLDNQFSDSFKIFIDALKTLIDNELKKVGQ